MSPRLKAYFIFGGLVGYIPNTYNTYREGDMGLHSFAVFCKCLDLGTYPS